MFCWSCLLQNSCKAFCGNAGRWHAGGKAGAFLNGWWDGSLPEQVSPVQGEELRRAGRSGKGWGSVKQGGGGAD